MTAGERKGGDHDLARDASELAALRRQRDEQAVLGRFDPQDILTLREAGASMVPINVLNPIKGTPYENVPPLPPMEVLKTIAVFRFLLPRQEITLAGGRTVNLRDMQSMIFLAGASALMVGNYLTTENRPVKDDLQMLKDLGLEPAGSSHEFSV